MPQAELSRVLSYSPWPLELRRVSPSVAIRGVDGGPPPQDVASTQATSAGQDKRARQNRSASQSVGPLATTALKSCCERNG